MYDNLKKEQIWIDRVKVGPKSSKWGQCELIENHNKRIHNPFHDIGKGPVNLYPRQIVFAKQSGWLPDNRKSKKKIDISHIGGRGNCVALGHDGFVHVNAELHSDNMIRISEHDEIDKIYKEECKHIENKISIRESKTDRFALCIEFVDCDDTKKKKKLKPKSFKNYDHSHKS